MDAFQRNELARIEQRSEALQQELAGAEDSPTYVAASVSEGWRLGGRLVVRRVVSGGRVTFYTPSGRLRFGLDAPVQATPPAGELAAGHGRAAAPAGDLRSWSRDDLMRAVRAAGIMYAAGHADDLTEDQAALLDAAARSYLVAEELPAGPEGDARRALAAAREYATAAGRPLGVSARGDASEGDPGAWEQL